MNNVDPLCNFTTFDEVYCQAYLIKQDKRIEKLKEYEYYSLCFRYLKYAISLFQYDCLHEPESNHLSKVQDYTPYNEITYEYICNGIDSSFSVSLYRNYEFIYVYIKYVDSEDYIEYNNYYYNEEDKCVVLTDTPPENSHLKITLYNVGHFHSVLDNREISILAEGMIIPFLEEQQNNTKLLNQIVYGGTTKIHSQAEHLKVVGDAIKNQYRTVDNLINEYSYKGNREHYSGLSGRYTVPRRRYR